MTSQYGPIFYPHYIDAVYSNPEMSVANVSSFQPIPTSTHNIMLPQSKNKTAGFGHHLVSTQVLPSSFCCSVREPENETEHCLVAILSNPAPVKFRGNEKLV